MTLIPILMDVKHVGSEPVFATRSSVAAAIGGISDLFERIDTAGCRFITKYCSKGGLTGDTCVEEEEDFKLCFQVFFIPPTQHGGNDHVKQAVTVQVCRGKFWTVHRARSSDRSVLVGTCVESSPRRNAQRCGDSVGFNCGTVLDTLQALKIFGGARARAWTVSEADPVGGGSFVEGEEEEEEEEENGRDHRQSRDDKLIYYTDALKE